MLAGGDGYIYIVDTELCEFIKEEDELETELRIKDIKEGEEILYDDWEQGIDLSLVFSISIKDMKKLLNLYDFK